MSPADHIGGEVLLQATNVAKTFGGLKAVDNVTFALRAGIITTLVGPNGAGKTTLFNLMTGHLVPDQGEVLAVGPGKRNDKGDFVALNIKVGDRVLFGKYSGQTVKVEGDELLVMREEDLFAVVEK